MSNDWRLHNGEPTPAAGSARTHSDVSHSGDQQTPTVGERATTLPRDAALVTCPRCYRVYQEDYQHCPWCHYIPTRSTAHVISVNTDTGAARCTCGATWSQPTATALNQFRCPAQTPHPHRHPYNVDANYNARCITCGLLPQDHTTQEIIWTVTCERCMQPFQVLFDPAHHAEVRKVCTPCLVAEAQALCALPYNHPEHWSIRKTTGRTRPYEVLHYSARVACFAQRNHAEAFCRMATQANHQARKEQDK